MTQKEKDLLLKDLSARLSYGVIIHEEWKYQNPGVEERTKKEENHIMNCYDLASIETIKPYLRSMSSMTEEEKNEYFGRTMTIDIVETSQQVIDWLLKHHFDYRGLIEKGLALEAPKNMYKTE